ncbi:hypothetical protein ACSYDW_07170 [Paeniglutamicibacter sp. R2-26]|uniref:hypothetical protein n=1 Tax=Paeniglutamicibacter sp. R2-26 TaxID=3144417 RepID=UPI003EE57773
MKTFSHAAKPVPASAAGGGESEAVPTDGSWSIGFVAPRSGIVDSVARVVAEAVAEDAHNDELECYLEDVRKTVSRPEHVNAVRSLPASFTF